jgi:hypothetical protein
MLLAIREFLSKCAAQSITLAEHGLTGELSLGVTVGDSVQFVACLDFSVNDLLSLGALGVELSLAAYPTSDEVNGDAS